MEKTYNPQTIEPAISALWEKSGYQNPDNLPNKDKKSPYTILLPPPNASGKMHTGNVLMIAIEDLLIRWKRMLGYKTLWIPGTDHAGFETQITFERMLKKEKKSRFDYDRKTLYKKIWNFVQKNKKDIEKQIRTMGASVDWSRYTFTLDPHVIKTVHDTFKRLHDDGLIYRDNYLVNYCPKCGTTFADLEIKYITRTDPLYYLKYGPLTVATVRPETKFGDTAIAVHPKDKRYSKFVGKTIRFEGINNTIILPVIADSFVDPSFGTGAVKVTPAHDKNDYEVALRHHLPLKQAIDLSGRLTKHAGKYKGLTVFTARRKVVEELKKKGLIEKIDTHYQHTVATCYKAGHDIEPMIIPNWFVRVDKKGKSLKKPAKQAVEKGEITIYPSWRKKTYISWMNEMRDWPISRQIVWGIRIPVWYDIDKNPDLRVSFLKKYKEKTHVVTDTIANLLKKYSFESIQKGLQTLIAPASACYVISSDKPKKGRFLPETDTFDTWFSSGQWPLVTLRYPSSKDFLTYYPTDVLETGWEIIRLWVSRMIMFGMYLTKKIPFHTVYLHGIVRAIDGRKMSKSLGNVINPEEYQKLYGTDALRMGLISGTANGKDFNFPKDKVIAYRNFCNKLWNIARYLLLQENKKMENNDTANNSSLSKADTVIQKKLSHLIQKTNKNLEKYRFAQAAEEIYHFVWDDFASNYLEKSKNHMTKNRLKLHYFIFISSLKLLHPFMPFVTEAIWQNIPHDRKDKKEKNLPLMICSFPC